MCGVVDFAQHFLVNCTITQPGPHELHVLDSVALKGSPPGSTLYLPPHHRSSVAIAYEESICYVLVAGALFSCNRLQYCSLVLLRNAACMGINLESVFFLHDLAEMCDHLLFDLASVLAERFSSQVFLLEGKTKLSTQLDGVEDTVSGYSSNQLIEGIVVGEHDVDGMLRVLVISTDVLKHSNLRGRVLIRVLIRLRVLLLFRIESTDSVQARLSERVMYGAFVRDLR